MDNVTPIRPSTETPTKLLLDCRDRLHDFQFRVGRAAALARAMAVVLETANVGDVGDFNVEASEGCLGIAELLDGIRTEMYDLSQGKSSPGEADHG